MFQKIIVFLLWKIYENPQYKQIFNTLLILICRDAIKSSSAKIS